ncbi:hypothetical protein [Hymenobacter volaticus]|uniref:M1 family peptidase n=1 Tax=Hymenobacter volaticus TaxID=2932254 RepID=A0ABY4G190_9BACT|nr:hypothetical protein [Hymenobacter volaticus]UOQ64645.1 hypothetical protein MUN86_13775 [Hymenobacter volaticus]
MMRNFSLLFLGLATATTAAAQQPIATNNEYRTAARKINDLVHTKLDVRFDYAKRYLYGKEWVTLKPHGYATDSLRLDAKGMDIKAVTLLQGNTPQPLKYNYNQQQLAIKLGRVVPVGEAYTIYIEYTAKPDELKVKGSAAIGAAKGLYFINPTAPRKASPSRFGPKANLNLTRPGFRPSISPIRNRPRKSA